MCGIAGIYAYHQAARDVNRNELRRIRDHMVARGPDGEGEWYSDDGRLGLGHRRLSIIDLSARAAQPMVSADGRKASASTVRSTTIAPCGWSWRPMATASAPNRTPRSCSTSMPRKARRCSTTCAACSPSAYGMESERDCCLRATPTASSPSTTRTRAKPCALLPR